MEFEIWPALIGARDLPVLTAGLISYAAARRIFADPTFPALKIGQRRVCRTDAFFDWLEQRETRKAQVYRDLEAIA